MTPIPSFFHISTIIKRHFNAIDHIKLTHGTWIHDRKQIGDAFVGYYCVMFCSISPTSLTDLYGYILPSVTHGENLALCRIPEDSEIKSALFSMGPIKAWILMGSTLSFINLLVHRSHCHYPSG